MPISPFPGASGFQEILLGFSHALSAAKAMETKTTIAACFSMLLPIFNERLN
jgi:hypothetical protein